jgi:hypothetical protein
MQYTIGCFGVGSGGCNTPLQDNMASFAFLRRKAEIQELDNS